ncbi:MAG: hypothetical protein KME35_03105 [Aphanocapsa sp. GSE-SYN-MK-11-07L]|jgi:hypothetical protein|nr:hypothetical protein [Aphanocapsa sp. GSE-SYN-MK-11-07L]
MFGIYGYGGTIGVTNILLGISCCIYYSANKPKQLDPNTSSPRSFFLIGNPARALKAEFLPLVLFLSGITAYFFGGKLDPFIALQQLSNNIIIVFLVLIDFKDNSNRQ